MACAKERFVDSVAVERLSVVKDAIRGIRNLRAELNVKPSQRIRVLLQGDLDSWSEFIPYIKFLARVEEVSQTASAVENAYSVVVGTDVFYVPLARHCGH